MNLNFWKDKRVFITGHSGFKGSWLSLILHELGAKSTGYSLPPSTTPSLFDSAKIQDVIHTQMGDIRDGNFLTRSMQAVDPEIVFHLAAQPLVRYSYLNPVETYEVNVMGTVNLLEAVRQCPNIRAVVVVTTDKCYENKEWLYGYREGDRLGGVDPYSNSKACSELVTSAYRYSYFSQTSPDHPVAAIASVRAGNVIGGGDWSQDRLIPDIITSFSQNKVVLIRNPQAIRPWQHVLDPLAGYLKVAEKIYSDRQASQAFNFGPADTDCLAVEDIVQKMRAIWGQGANFEIFREATQPHEATFLKLDSSKAKSMLNWRPQWNIDTALKNTVLWYRAFYSDHSQARDITTRQIREYFDQYY